MRKNGFEAPLEPLQVLTWLLLLAIVGGYYAFISPGLTTTWCLVAGVAYGLLATSTTLSALIACYKDPIDPNVRRFHQRETAAAGSSADKTFCFLCQLHVNKGSRHCRYCDKCVDKFDHHCKWLNNCVGRSNYRYFLALLVTTFLMTGLQLGLSVWFAVLFHTGDKAFTNRVESAYIRLDPTTHIALVYMYGVIILPFLALLAQLLGFHIMLISQGLTTYDYIVQEQRRERERKERRRKLDKDGGGRRAAACCSASSDVVHEEAQQAGLDGDRAMKTSQGPVP